MDFRRKNMKKYKYIILGGGATGLSLAVSLLRGNEKSFIVLEKEKDAGGLCRSEYIDGGPVDIGGGHILGMKKPDVLDLMFSFLPKDEWVCIKRSNTIKVKDFEVGYPIEAHIWQFPKDEQEKYLESISNAACLKGEEMPEKFTDWITWKFGDKIANDYMLPYNRKIWQVDLDTLGTYWLYKLPNVSYEDTLRSCQEQKFYGAMPAHDYFYYPKKYGYGEAFLRMADYLGEHIKTDYTVTDLDWENLIVNGEYQAEYIINTIPWQEIESGFPEEIKAEIDKLSYTSVDIDYYDEEYDHHTQMTYFADENLPYHRTIYRKEFMQLSDVRGFWTEANSKIGCKKGKLSYTNKYAYPINTIEKPESAKKVQSWAKKQKILSIGRWGDWQYHNSDIVMQQGIDFAKKLLDESV